MVTLNYQSISLIRHILTTTGETEMVPDGQGGVRENPTARKLNGEESSSRRWFTKATKEITEPIETKVKEIQETHNNLVEEKRKEYKEANKKEAVEGAPEKSAEEKKLEKDAEKFKEDLYVSKDKAVKDSLEKAKTDVEALYAEKYDVDLTDKTLKFVKKYLDLWGEDPGWSVGDDSAVEALYEMLK